MNELMKQQKQLELTCYKMEIAMGVEAWYFLYGTTCGTCNLFYFFSLLSGMATEDTACNKRGMAYTIRPGQRTAPCFHWQRSGTSVARQ